ncbi:3'(2'),5'-bisphosphate nucleotidase CysQ [Pseudomonadota bacterium]
MQLTSDDLMLLSQQATFAAKQAGALITQRAQQPISVQKKKGVDQLASQVVTEIDHLSQALILDTLLPTCATYDLALLTEESTDDKQRLKKDYFWCIDPLDGTLPFVESIAGYSVSIALVSRSGIPQIGVVYDPVEQTLYSAVRGQGAFRNGQLWAFPSSDVTTEKTLTLVCDRSLVQRADYPNVIEALERMASQLSLAGVRVVNQGGAVMNACWVIENNPACYFKFPKPQDGGGSLWDFAATACLFHELGAIACDFHGQPLDLNRADSTFMNHRGVIFAEDLTQVEQIRALYSGL